MAPAIIHRFSFKTVPMCSPKGMLPEIIKKRFEKAHSQEILEQIAESIARYKDHFRQSDISMLRDYYREEEKKVYIIATGKR